MTDSDRPSLADRRGQPDVYQAAEDSDLLATAVSEADISDVSTGLDVGTGSGYVGTTLTELCDCVVATDINPFACEQAREVTPNVLRANLLDGFRTNSIDLVTFNPPYLPTDPDNEWGDLMELALSGGPDGRKVIEPFLSDVGRVLTPTGCAFVLISSLTDIEAVRAFARQDGLDSTIVKREAHPFERLVVIRFSTV